MLISQNDTLPESPIPPRRIICHPAIKNDSSANDSVWTSLDQWQGDERARAAGLGEFTHGKRNVTDPPIITVVGKEFFDVRLFSQRSKIKREKAFSRLRCSGNPSGDENTTRVIKAAFEPSDDFDRRLAAPAAVEPSAHKVPI
jgi:hypothetical protein